MADKRRTHPAEVVKAQADFEHWRTHRQGNKPIPDELWQVAAAAAHQHGLNLVSRVLRLNYTKLKQCLLAQQPPAPVMSRKTQHGQGFWLCYKRLSEGRFKYWPTTGGQPSRELRAHELQVLLTAGDPSTTRAAPEWRSVRPPLEE